jgi:hypothetical protein
MLHVVKETLSGRKVKEIKDQRWKNQDRKIKDRKINHLMA